MDRKKKKKDDGGCGSNLVIASQKNGKCISISGADHRMDRYSENRMLRRINPQADDEEEEDGHQDDELIKVLMKQPSHRLRSLLIEMEEFEDTPSNGETSSSGPSSSSSAPISNPTCSLNAAPFFLLRIGSWQAEPSKEGELVAKFNYKTKKLSWEIRRDGVSKQKIEIDWSNIIGIRATKEKHRIGTLQLELQKPPRFYKEIEAKPPKWMDESDFTQDRASLNRRHFAMFPRGVLDAHYNKLMKNKHLLERSKPHGSFFFFNFPVREWSTNLSSDAETGHFNGIAIASSPFKLQVANHQRDANENTVSMDLLLLQKQQKNCSSFSDASGWNECIQTFTEQFFTQFPN